MKNCKLKLAFVILLCVNVLASITVSAQNEKSNANPKSLALVSTMLGKIVQSPIPLLDAPPFNKKTNSIADLIIKEEEKVINEYRESIGLSLKKFLKYDVIYGSALVAKPEYQEVIKKYNFPASLETGDDNFDKIIIPSDEKNLFLIADAKRVDKTLKNEALTKNTIIEISKLLGVDIVVVAYISMYPSKYGMFGGHAKIGLMTNLCFYNKEGKLIVNEWFSSDPLKIVGDNIAEYKTILNSLQNSLLLDKMVLKISGKLAKIK